jgi:geranylgeranyl diphosphate synthase, type II
MHTMKTGALIRASVMSVACLVDGLVQAKSTALLDFSESIGLAFQIRDDILDVEGRTEVIGKKTGADAKKSKATWPALFGLDESRRHCASLLDQGLSSLEVFGRSADSLRALARYIVERKM